MPLVLGFVLIALFIWLGENIGTYTKTWLYPSQLEHWHVVGAQKLGSWLLLMVTSFILVDTLYYLRAKRAAQGRTVKRVHPGNRLRVSSEE